MGRNAPRRFDPKRGDVFFADLEPVRGSEQGGDRPVLVVQNNIGNRYSPVAVVLVMTTKFDKIYPGHVFVPARVGMPKDSVVLVNQIRTLHVDLRFRRYLCHLPDDIMARVDAALKIHLALDVCPACHAPRPTGSDFCSRCGTLIQQHCQRCGGVMELQWTYCPRCGTRKGGATH